MKKKISVIQSDKIGNLVEKLNNIFKNIEESTKHIFLEHKIKMRNRDININDVIYSRLAYSEIDKTKTSICSKINYDKENRVHRTSYYRKEQKFPVEFYGFILNRFRDIHKEFCTTPENNQNNTQYTCMAIDGTYNNTSVNQKPSKCIESLNMGYYDITNCIPIDITIHGRESKNCEIKKTEQYIKQLIKNKEYDRLKRIIIIADRGYFCYDFFNFLDKNGVKYIIRLRENSNMVTQKSCPKMDNLKEKCRIVESTLTYKKTVDLSKKLKIKNSSDKKVLQIESTWHLITNLTDIKLFPDEKIIGLYKERWSIEVYFKFIKNNFNFSHTLEKSSVGNNKLVLCIQILSILSRIVKHIGLMGKDNKDNKIVKRNGEIANCKNVINETLLMEGIFEHIVKNMSYGALTTNNFTNLLLSYFEYKKLELGRNFDRKCKTPFKKWYVKQYHSLYDFKKIISYLENNDVKINKNLKSKAQYVKIIYDG